MGHFLLDIQYVHCTVDRRLEKAEFYHFCFDIVSVHIRAADVHFEEMGLLCTNSVRSNAKLEIINCLFTTNNHKLMLISKRNKNKINIIKIVWYVFQS